MVLAAWSTASLAIRADSWTCRLISLTEDAISSVADATDCTLVEASSEAAETVVASSCARSAVEVSVPADASSSVEAEETVSTISPIMASKSRVMLSTRRPRSILASASRAAASSAAFLATSASLNTCKASAMAPISVCSPRRVTVAERSPLPSACIGFTIEAIPRERSRTR